MQENDNSKPVLLLVDGHSLAFRSYYAYSKNFEILFTAPISNKEFIKEGSRGEIICEGLGRKIDIKVNKILSRSLNFDDISYFYPEGIANKHDFFQFTASFTPFLSKEDEKVVKKEELLFHLPFIPNKDYYGEIVPGNRLTTESGIPTSITFGFLKSLFETCKRHSPQGVCIAFDTKEITFRQEIDPKYKANRGVPPSIFLEDIKRLENILVKYLNLKVFKYPYFEADDVLGSLSKEGSKKNWFVKILSGDKDLFQLVDSKKDIYVLYMGSGGPFAKSSSPIQMDEEAVLEKIGVEPKKVVDLKALMGDPSDNISGVKGIGSKTAINLLSENKNIEEIYRRLDKVIKNDSTTNKGFIKGSVLKKLQASKENIVLPVEIIDLMNLLNNVIEKFKNDNLKKPTVEELAELINIPKEKFMALIKEDGNLITFDSSAHISKFLATIKTDLELGSDNFLLSEIDTKQLSKVLEELELNSLLRQVDTFKAIFSVGGFNKNNANINKQSQTDKELLLEKKQPIINVQIIQDLDNLKAFIKRLENTNDIVSIDTETTSLNPLDAELVSIGFCLGDKNNDIYYIPVGHKSKDSNLNQLSIDEVFFNIKSWIENPNKEKALQNCKFDRQIFMNHGLNLKGVTFDTLLADYILNNQEKHGLADISLREFGFKPSTFKETIGKNKDFSFVEIKDASIYCGYDVLLTYKITKIFIEKFNIEKNNLIKLFKKIELPLEQVLSQMEMNGILIDVPYLKELSRELKSTIENIESKVFEQANEDFNLSSPKQLGEILFEKLNLDKKKSRKTKTGWSTDAVVLERLVDDHEIIPNLIKHRTLSKLLSTYIDALPSLINKKTGRVHTNFNQAATATGRLSSSNPNLQNIPVRTEFSRRIRKAFLPEKNWKLISADYSQIELRILAHLANEEILINAFNKNEDIHSLTARLIFEKDEINSDERRVGKTINFGVIYGMGPKKFARSTGVSSLEAKEFLIKYKERYSKIFKYLELQERLALCNGYVETIFGRRREFKFDKNGLGRLRGKDPYEIDLQSARRAGIEAQSLRAAANAPIQGSSADIIKVAMIQLNRNFTEMNIQSKMLLQVHDELLFEVEPDSLQVTTKLIKDTMENCVKLKVPLLVDIGIGDNWMETK